MCTSFCASPSNQTTRGNSRPFADELGDVFFVDFFLQHRRIFLHERESLFRFLQLLLGGSDLAVADFGYLRQFARRVQIFVLRF